MRHVSRFLLWFLNLRLPLLFLLALVVLFWAYPGDAAATSSRFIEPIALESTAEEATAPLLAGYMIQLDEPPVLEFYNALAAGDQAQTANVAAVTQAHLASVDQAQQALMAELATYDAQVIYRVQRVFNGIAVYVPVDQVAALAALPGVQGVYPLVPKTPSNSRGAQLLHTPEIWEGIDRAGLTGQGVSIAIIDTGIDYLHTMFGGPGGGYALNDTTVAGDVPSFPSAKIGGGYDFTGDGYDASVTSAFYQPIPHPDADPMDCYGFGHGTHVAGTAGGYGVRSDGTTYPGPYDSSIDFSQMRIGPGMAPEATLYALKVFGCSGSSDVVDAAIEWAVDPNQDGDFSDHVDVINLSLGSSFGSPFDSTVVAVENAATLGIIVVTSAGNTGDAHYAIGSPGMATRAIAVAATSIDTTDPNNFTDGSIATFSARGPRRGDGGLKPDLAAPGVNIISSRRATGNLSISSSGTSMASPMVAGIMALLREAYPEEDASSWRAEELKALVMNSAVYPLVRSDVGDTAYSMLRAGAGRVDPTAALHSNLIAFDAALPEQVSVSFGIIEVLDSVTVVRSIRLANKANVPISVTVGYTAFRELPGVMLDVGISNVISVPANGFATMPVTLTADAAAMTRSPDPTRQANSTNGSPWLDEVSGYIIFTPISSTQGSPIHLPIHALPRTTSAFSVVGGPLVLGTTPTATFALTVTGSAVSVLPAPTATVPLMGVFSLAHNSPPITKTPDEEDPVLAHFAQADLRYIGTAGPLDVDGEPMVYFALVTYGPWSTPLEITFQIEIDINDDQIVDYRLVNREATDVSSFDLITTDEFVSMLETSTSVRTVQGPLNLFPASEYDTRAFNSNVMALPLRVGALGSDVSQIHYRVVAYSRDVTNTSPVTVPVDETPRLALNVIAPAGIEITTPMTPSVSLGALFPGDVGNSLRANINRASYFEQQGQGMLVVYMHNESATTRTQVLPVEFTWLNIQYLPRIGGD